MQIPWQCARAKIDPMDAAGFAERRGGIHAHEPIEAGPLFDQAEHVAAAEKYRNVGRQPPTQLLRDDRADRIVAAIRIADTDHEHFAGRHTWADAPDHVRCTDSLRKWAEHEMQGS